MQAADVLSVEQNYSIIELDRKTVSTPAMVCTKVTPWLNLYGDLTEGETPLFFVAICGNGHKNVAICGNFDDAKDYFIPQEDISKKPINKGFSMKKALFKGSFCKSFKSVSPDHNYL